MWANPRNVRSGEGRVTSWRRVALAASIAAVIAVPTGLALADTMTAPSSLDYVDTVPATECPAAAEFMRSIGFEHQRFAPDCPSVPQLEAKLTNPDPTVPSIDELPGGQQWAKENDVPVLEVEE